MSPDHSPATETIEEQRGDLAPHALFDTIAPNAGRTPFDMALVVANALGAAWATYQLHPDPRGRLGFDRALRDLADAPGIEHLEVGPRSFTWDGSEVPASHAGAGRIVDRLFVTGVASIQFHSSPDGDDLVALFDVIRRTPTELEEKGGASIVLKASGVQSIRLLDRRVLSNDEDRDDPIENKAHAGARDLSAYAGDPEALAAALLEAAGGDSTVLSSLVIESYQRAHASIDPEDIWEREEIVHTFVDMFFYFPPGHQAPLISEILALQHEAPFRIFLDQLASHELNELAPLLDPETHPLLLEYARISGDTADRSKEIIDLINESGPEDSVDMVVARRIEAVLAPGSDDSDASGGNALARLADQRPQPENHSATGTTVIQRLLAVVDSNPDTRRVLRIWAGKIAHAIRCGDPESALTWLRAVSDTGSLANPSEGRAFQALHKAVGVDVAAGLAEILHATPESVEGAELLHRLTPHVTDHLIELLGSEEDHGRRRELLVMVGEVSRDDPTRVVAHLDDSRWYLVRNLVLVLGRCEHPEVVRHIEALATHLDDRVRREALRAIYALARTADIEPFIGGLVDPHESVRKVAATILRTCQRAELAPALEALLASPADTAVKLDVIALLGLLPGGDARAVLEGFIQARGGSWGASRTLRVAARAALGDLR